MQVQKKSCNFAQNFRSMYSEVLRIIEGGLHNDARKIVNYSQRLAAQLEAEGDKKTSASIQELLRNSHAHMATLDQYINLPVDSDSRMRMAEVSAPSTKATSIVLEDLVENQVRDFVKLVNRRADLIRAGVDVRFSMLLYGAPGCGKTSIAHFVSEQTGLPLLIVRLDSLVSSLLGNTAKNIRKVFEFADGKPCILFLDEFDAIAKARDDVHELGELKRVINSLLQNIDSMAPDSVLMAATNHAELLDKAVWRRFQTTIEVGNPSNEIKQQILKVQIGDFPCEFIRDNKQLGQLATLLEQSSPADMHTTINKAKAKSVLEGQKALTYPDVVMEIYNYTQRDMNIDALVQYMSQAGIPQTTISHLLNISLRQVKQVMSKSSQI